MEYGKDRDNQPHTDYLHFKLQEDDNILSITHEQEQPAYKLEYHYTNYEKIKTHYLRKSTSFVKMTWTLLCDAFTRKNTKRSDDDEYNQKYDTHRSHLAMMNNTATYSRNMG